MAGVLGIGGEVVFFERIVVEVVKLFGRIAVIVAEESGGGGIGLGGCKVAIPVVAGVTPKPVRHGILFGPNIGVGGEGKFWM